VAAHATEIRAGENRSAGLEAIEGHFEKAAIVFLLLGNCFWREGFEAAFGPDRMGEKGGCCCRKWRFFV
jgi:hypothetical protein